MSGRNSDLTRTALNFNFCVGAGASLAYQVIIATARQ